ncbi:MAG: bifunctional phosphoribosylaminoimidazolecarboxamide formyltransferase/IMP cyclohydrolase [Bacteroidetes bacterium]|uniref:Bifunctional purine biosynthesis protein PurH n=1 Tax=Candidatus Cryptobacteroides intestinigallinarum TaxID=2840767 RepID=A0A9D9MZN5_9BACT|nr:bifunctional phosphoribosylaminoimidazolecarboxamide formyltransferase/IMP cyclohydrolase [Candidatus Cryptobacteroides intestinigallinarum]
MRALFSVSDKTGVVEFASGLESLGWEIIATGGTMKLLQEAGLKVINISEITGFPEICDGRVKTLHPKVHGALLGRRDLESHRRQLKENGIEYIDMVCVNLYPFKQTISKPDVTMEDAIENIDIGGPSMLRSAAKNWRDVTVVCHPEDYKAILDEIRSTGNTLPETRLKLSAKAYTHTAEYDIMIATYMRKQAGLNEKLFLEYDLKQSLRYGENPHQQAKFYASIEKVPYSLATAEQLNGKELSYNNIQDANAALNIVREFDCPFCVGLKHMNPCGAAIGKDVTEAWKKAFEADKVSIFGGIVATNREIDLETAQLMKPIFLEIIMAPSFSDEALELLRTKKNLRLLKVDMTKDTTPRMQYVSVNGGMLAQNQDLGIKEVTADMCVTKVKPDEAYMSDLNFAWKIVKHIKSNAIVVVKDGMTLGVGAGQMNRIGSAKIALEEAEANLKEKGVDVRTVGLVMGSDAFFPFDDCVTLAHEYGVKAIAQPGGSIRDNDSIVKADEYGISMMFTGERHFKH